MTKLYDDALKKLFRANAQDFVAFVRKDLLIEEPLPTELDKEHIHADGLLRCRDAQGRVLLTHFEFQRDNDKHMGERLLEYNVLASRQNNYLPVVSCVIYLNNSEKVPRSPFVRRLPDGTATTFFHYARIRIGTFAAKELLALGRTGILPLLPLTRGGKVRKTIDIMIEKLFKEGQSDLLWIGLSLAGATFTKKSDLEWLRRRRAMLNDFLATSPIYQDVIAEAMTKGEAKGEARGEAKGEAIGKETGKLQAFATIRQRFAIELPRMVAARFPALEALAQQCVEEPNNDYEALLHLFSTVGSAQTELEARRLLEANGNTN